MANLDDARDSAWCRMIWNGLAEGGMWGVPRNGLVFHKRGDRLVLTDQMPYSADMPGTADDLAAYQASEFELIRERFALAGITVEKP